MKCISVAAEITVFILNAMFRLTLEYLVLPH